MKVVIVAALCAVALAQWNWGDNSIDSLHGFRVQYDDRHDILLMYSDRECYLVEATDATWDQIVRDDAMLHNTVDKLYAQVQAGTGLTSMTHDEASQYHSRVEEFECRRKSIFKVTYTSGAAATTPTTTIPTTTSGN